MKVTRKQLTEFVCKTANLMPENIPAGQFLRKADKKLYLVYSVHFLVGYFL
jgi:hypothetical protein